MRRLAVAALRGRRAKGEVVVITGAHATVAAPRPAGVPVEQLTRSELVIDAKTAHALGIGAPASLRRRADGVVE